DYHEVPPTIIEDVIEEDVIEEDVIEEDVIEEDVIEEDVIEEDVIESNDQIVSNTSNIQSTEETIIEDKSDLESENNSIIKDVVEEIPQQQTNISENKKQNNLSVEDIELGQLLNQINLECDSSTFTDTISYYDGMGPALYRLCKFDSSLNFFNESLIGNPNDVEILVNKGSTLGKLGYFSEAIVYYDQAIDIDPHFLPAKNNKANALANLGNSGDAILLYNEILEENPNYITASKNLEIALSQSSNSHNINDRSLKSNTYNIIYPESSLPETINSTNHEKQKPTNFFEEVSLAFSSLGSLFSFLN
ncbi:MAG: tetratricopeptide repeat protein, partial [Nitrosopumilus sp.]